MGKSNFHFACKRMVTIADNGCPHLHRDGVLFLEGDVGGGSWKTPPHRYISGDDRQLLGSW